MSQRYTPQTAQNPATQNQGSQLPPTLYEGVVVGNMMPNNIIRVRLVKYGRDVDCVWAASIVSGLLGFKTSYVPPKKTPVIVWITGTDTNYIVGSQPLQLTDTNNQSRTVTGPGAPDNHANQIFSSRNSTALKMFASQKPPVDLVEGEIDVSNLLGVGLTLLRNMASIQSGDLARVECCLLDDMVRVISDTFKHYSAFGDYKISNDGGKLNVVWHGTSHDHEAWGNKNKGDAKLSPNSKGDNLNLNTVNGATDDGRWRFSQYVGWLGNFVNIFVTDPVNAMGQILEGQYRSGKARIHVNDDGSILFQSVADIVLEKVIRIPVPNPLRLEDDPNGNRSDQVLQGQNNLSTWKPSDSSNIFEMAFQLREYARWLNNSLSLGRFRQMNLDYEVPTEAQTPAPDLHSADPDKAKQNAGITNWRIAYATIRIYRDGSIQQVDAYGNSMTMTKTGLQISTPTDMLLQAGGSVNIVAGRDINLVARKAVGITSVTDMIRMKAETGLQFFCNAGNIVLETTLKYVLKFIGLLNANNTAQLDPIGNLTLLGGLSANGDVASSGVLQALMVQAAITHYEDDHFGHLFPLADSPPISIVPENHDNFQFPDQYMGEPLYQTLTDQMASIGDIKTSGTWDLSNNEISGKGSPWPGSQKMKKPLSSASLNKVLTHGVPSATSAGMTTTNPVIHYQT